MDALRQEYDQRCQETLRFWQQCAHQAQAPLDAFYPANKRAITTGIRPALPAAANALLHDLTQITAGDPLAETAKPDQLHFTFLAITTAIFDDMPPPYMLASLRLIWPGPFPLRIRNLRLVALPNQLLLAGEPDAESIEQRQELVNMLANSPWKAGLVQRYQHDSLPPRFWHSTILRYRATTLPAELRDWFIAQKHRNYGEVVAHTELVLADYQWQQVTAVPLT